MNVLRFQLFNVGGAVLWVGSLVTLGYFFGNVPIIKEHLKPIVLIGISAAAVPVVLGALWKLFKRDSPSADDESLESSDPAGQCRSG